MKRKESVLEDLVREVTALWQTQEFRAKPPTPTDGHILHQVISSIAFFSEARGGLHIVEQSLWNAIPSYVRTLDASLKKATGVRYAFSERCQYAKSDVDEVGNCLSMHRL